MTEADKNFINTCKEILEHGYSSEGTNVRTRWEDGEEANYYSIVGVQNKYDLEKEFPMITLRNNTNTVKRAIDEILWIWQKKSNKVSELNSHIWDQWAGEDGTIGKAYGYQFGKKYEFKTKEGIKEMDQVDYVLYLLKNDPSSRRIMTNLFNHEELKDMNLEPCAFGTQWLVKEGKLHLILNQRSQDMLAANGWNTMQYAALVHMFAKVSGLKPGTLTHNIGDCHIYDRHVPFIEKLLEAKPIDVKPQLIVHNDTNNFYDFKVEDFEIVGYDYNKEIKLRKNTSCNLIGVNWGRSLFDTKGEEMLSIIVAVAKNNVIGKDNKLIWHLPADLKRFKEITNGKTIIMGRKTFESLGRVLPNRKHIILTKNKDFKYDDKMVEIVTDIKELDKYIKSSEENFVIGGASIYKMLMPYSNKMYVTKIEEDFAGDTFFPDIDEKDWKVETKEKGITDEKNPYSYEYITYVRK